MEYDSDNLYRVIEAYIDYVPYSLFSVLETDAYLNHRKLGVLDFETEISKAEFQANAFALAGLLERFSVESDTELGQFHFDKMDEWLEEYINRYGIRQEELDIYKVAYSFGLAFYEFLRDLERQGNSQDAILLYQRVTKQLMLDILNKILKNDTSTNLNSQMLLKLRLTMHNNEEQQLYGRFGVYSIFKNCSLFWYANTRFRT